MPPPRRAARGPVRAQRSGRREPPAAPAAAGPGPPHAVTGAPPSARQTLLAPDSRRPTGLAAPPGAGPVRHGRAVAPPGVAAVLALDVAAAGWAAAAQPRGPGADRPDGPREPRVGQ